MEKFKIGEDEYVIRMTYLQAIKILPEKYNIRITQIFSSEEAAAETMQNLILDDELTLKLMWHYAEETASLDYEGFLDQVTGQQVDAFRDAFWREVVNFSGPLKKNLLEGAWKEFKKDLKKATFQELPNEKSSV